MKKTISVFILLAILVFAGCAGNKDKTNNPTGESFEFYGVVLENLKTTILVEPEADSWVRNSSDKVSIFIKNAELINSEGEKITTDKLAVGTKIKIFFTGGIAESYPAQIHNCFKVGLIENKYTLDDFWAVLMDKKEESQTESLLPDDVKENYADITPVAVLDEIGGQIFKDSQWCSAYLLYNDEIYPMGNWFGGMGVVDIKTCDFDGNGVKDIIFTYSWGSGIHRALIGLFDMSKMEQTVVYNSQDENDEIYQNSYDLVLEKRSDNQFNVYVAEFQNQEDINFAALNPKKGKVVGTITAKNGLAKWQPD